ncbi:MAG: hypothetical protein IPN29_10475 [Saprospiraceae bacterium]|nr:hypothetical protein [Saprospiraceae bacterium]
MCPAYLAEAQVTKVDYQIRFNKATSFFDCFIIIKEGSAISFQHRTQLSAQYTVIVPTGSTVSIAQLHMPLQNNQGYNGTTPAVWTLSNSVSHPASQPFSDFYGLTPSITPSSQYNNLNTLDTVRLFSLQIDLPPLSCRSGVRLFKNNIDPGPAAPGMGGGDFSNGFTIGNTLQRYQGNLPEIMAKENVSNVHDAGNGSLRKAIFCAENNSTILFEDSLTEKSVQLLSPLFINKNIHLTRPFNKVINIKAPNSGPAILVQENNTLTIKHIKFHAGNNALGNGRILVNNGTLSLNQVHFYDAHMGTGSQGATILNNSVLVIEDNCYLHP